MFGETIVLISSSVIICSLELVSSQLRALLFDLSILSLSDELDLLSIDEANLFSSSVVSSLILSTGLSDIPPFWRSSAVTGLL